MRRWKRINPGNRHRRGASAAFLAAVALMVGPALGQESESPPATSDPSPASEGAPLSTDRTAASVPDLARLVESRDGAALALAIRSVEDWGWIEAAMSMLVDPAHLELCADSAVAKAIAGRLTDAPPAHRPGLLAALGRSSDRDAIRAVLGLLEKKDLTAETRRRAFETLVEQTGRSDLGEDAASWRAWWAEHEWIPEGEWIRRVARRQAERSRRLLERARGAERGRAELFRELYSLSPAESRPGLLIRLLGDGAVEVRRLGLDLASRAVVNATPLPAEVIGHVTTLLRDPAPEVRAGAATLLASAGINGASSDISQALGRENHPSAARAMLEALSFTTPSRTDLEAAASWLDDALAAPAAARLLNAGAERGVLVSPRIRNLAWNAVEDDRGVSLGEAGVILFGALAPAGRFSELADLLQNTDRGLRDAAAEALSARLEGVEPLFQAAGSEPAMVRYAIEAAALWRPTAQSWMTATRLEGVTESQLIRIAESMSDREAIVAAREEADDARRLTLLRRFAPGQARGAAGERRAAQDGARMRVRTLFSLGRHEDIIEESRAFAERAGKEDLEIRPLLRMALLCMERIDEATEAGITAEEWILAIERVAKTDPEAARRLAQALQSQDNMGLSTAQVEHLDALTGELAGAGDPVERPPNNDG